MLFAINKSFSLWCTKFVYLQLAYQQSLMLPFWLIFKPIWRTIIPKYAKLTAADFSYSVSFACYLRWCYYYYNFFFFFWLIKHLSAKGVRKMLHEVCETEAQSATWNRKLLVIRYYHYRKAADNNNNNISKDTNNKLIKYLWRWEKSSSSGQCVGAVLEMFIPAIYS